MLSSNYTLLNINSKSKKNNTDTPDNFTFNKFNGFTSNNIKLSSLEFPVGFYNVRTTNNIFTITIGASSYTATPPAGNYTINELMDEIKNQINAQITTFNYSINSKTSKITITHTSSFIINETLLAYNLGFTNFTTSSTSKTAPNIFQINDKYFIIQIIGLETDWMAYTGQPHISFKIPLNANFQEFLYYNEEQLHQNIRTPCNRNIINEIIIKLVDENGAALSNNGIDWSMTLTIT